MNLRIGTTTAILALLLGAAPIAHGNPTADLVAVGAPSQSPAQPGDAITFPFEMADPDEGIHDVSFLFHDPIGRWRWASSEWGQVQNGVVRLWVESTWLSGEYTLEEVWFSDGGQELKFKSDGTITNCCSGDTIGTHEVDFTASSFVVDNEDDDQLNRTAPELTAIDSPQGGTFNFNDSVILGFEAHDELGIADVFFVYEDPAGRTHNVVGGYGDPAEGRIGYKWASGRSRLTYVAVLDGGATETEYITTTYLRNGSVLTYPGRAIYGERAHSFDFSAFDITVDNAEYDVDYPRVSAITRTGGTVVHPGQKLEFSYDVTETHLASFGVAYTAGDEWIWLGAEASASPTGVVVLEFEESIESGVEYSAFKLVASDLGYQHTEYFRDGSWYDDFDEGDHELDIPQLDFVVEPWPYEFTDASGAGAVYMSKEEREIRIDVLGETLLGDEILVTELPTGRWAVRAANEDWSLTGTFNPTDETFRALAVVDGTPIVLGR